MMNNTFIRRRTGPLSSAEWQNHGRRLNKGAAAPQTE